MEVTIGDCLDDFDFSDFEEDDRREEAACALHDLSEVFVDFDGLGWFEDLLVAESKGKQDPWSREEENRLMSAVRSESGKYGSGMGVHLWNAVASLVGSRSSLACKMHYHRAVKAMRIAFLGSMTYAEYKHRLKTQPQAY